MNAYMQSPKDAHLICGSHKTLSHSPPSPKVNAQCALSSDLSVSCGSLLDLASVPIAAIVERILNHGYSLSVCPIS